MAYDILDYPIDYSSANGDLVYVVHDSSYTQPNFKYVADIYLVDVGFICTLKVFPDSNGNGVFNIGNIARNYVSTNTDVNNFQSGVNKIWMALLSGHRTSIEVRFGHEYGIPVTTTTNIESIGQTFYNHYNGRLPGGQYTILNNYTNNWLTNRPQKSIVDYNQPVIITFWGIIDSHCSGTNPQLQFRFFYKNGTATTITYTPINGSFPNSSSPKVYNVSLAQLIADGVSITNPQDIIYYEVTSSVTTYAGTCETSFSLRKQFTVNCDGKYTPTTLMWLNKLGGYDSYIFSKASRKSYTTEKKSFNQRNYNIVEGNYSLYNGRFVNDNAITYNSSFKEKWNLNTDIIDESTYSWLAELITSPQVFYYDNGYYYPIQITDTNYEFKKWINDRAFNLNLNIEFGDTFNTQYR